MVAGNIADIAWAPQTAKGSAAAVALHRVFLAGGDQPHPNVVKENFEESTGLRMLSDSYISTVNVEGAPEIFAMCDSLGSLLYHALGAETVTGAGDPYTHTIVPAATLPYLTAWRMLTNGLFEKFWDLKVSHLKIHFESYKPLRVTATVMGGKISFLAAAADALAAEKTSRLLHYDGSGTLKFEGTAVASISAGDIDIDNGEATQPGDSLSPEDTLEGRLSVVLSGLNMKVSDYALYNRLVYGSATPTTADVPVSTPLELAGSPAGIDFLWTRSANRSLEIKIPRVQVAPFVDQPNTDGAPLRRTISLEAYQPASGASITAVVKNSKSVHTA